VHIKFPDVDVRRAREEKFSKLNELG
jgi:hypothetical protein